MNFMKRKLCMGILLLGAILLVGCGAGQKDSRVQVVSTIGMIADVVSVIGGDHVNSISLMGPGVDPHLYKASEGDVRRLSKADVIFYNGLHLEAKMGEVIEKMTSRTRVAVVTSTIDRSALMSPPEYEGYYDPHVWFDVTMWAKAAQVIAATLIEEDPDNKEAYLKNLESYLKTLSMLDTLVREKSGELPVDRRVLVTAHDAFGYFGRAYGFKVVGLQGISTEAEAGTKDVQKLATYIVQERIPAIFVESSIPVRHIKAVKAAAKAKGWDVKIGGELFTDALGEAGTPEGTYVGMVKHNIETIVNALK